MIKCQECNGSGFLPEYSHIYAGKCFSCNGRGVKSKRKKIKSIKVPNNCAHVSDFTDAFQIEHVIAWLEATNSNQFLARDPGTQFVTLH
jgi:DnaJ-class molecular chaperone